MKRVISILCLFTFLTSAAYPMARVNPDVGSFLNIGTGYDIVSGNTAASCINPQIPVPVSTGVAEVSAHLTYINDYESLAKSLEISSSTNVKIGMPAFKFNLDATSKFFSEQNLDEESIYFMVEVSVKMPMEKITAVSLNEKYRMLLVAEGGAEAFRRACGDEYVDAIQKGGKLYGLVKISALSKEEKKQLEVTIRGKAGKLISTSLSLKQTLKEITRNYHYELFFSQIGGIAEDLPLFSDTSMGEEKSSTVDSFEELFKQAKEFAKKLADSKTGVIIMSNTAPYAHAVNYPIGVSPIRAANKVNTIEKYSQFRFGILKVLNYLDSIMINKDDYELISDEIFNEVTKTRDQYLRNMEILNEFADNCFYDLRDCKIPASADGFNMSSYPRVNRKNGNGEILVEVPSIDPPKKCLKKLFKEDTGKVCGFERIQRGRGAVCGVDLYNERTDPACGVTNDYLKQEYDPGYRNCLIDRENVNTDTAFNLKLWDRFFPDYDWQCQKGNPSSIGRPRRRGGDVRRQSICQNRHTGHWWIICRGDVPKTCRHASFGVERYNECEHESFGVTYLTCRHESFGEEGCLIWDNH